MKQEIQLSDHFTYRKLLRFTVPSIAMMIFTSVYGVVDGFFVSNFVGKTPFAAVNFVMPFLMILGGTGFMFGTGGSALVSKTMGEGDTDRANRIFSLITYVCLGAGCVVSVLGMILIRPVAAALGAEGEMLNLCVLYGRILLLGNPAFTLQTYFQSFFVTAQKPKLGLYVTVAAGVANMVLDALFVGLFQWGIVGAAVATIVGQFIGGIFPLVYFARPNSSLLRLTRTQFCGTALIKTCTNGSSELLNNISMSLVGMLYNVQLMKYAGENGVAAYGVLMYVCLIFIGAFIGYSVGTAPIVGFHYGAKNHTELRNVLRKSLVIIGSFSVSMLLLGEVLATPLSEIFVGYDQTLLSITQSGFVLFSFSFLFAGIGIYGSGFFTALNNGLISALVSFLRTMVFQVVSILVLPLFFDVNGIWISLVVAEALAAAVTVCFMVGLRKKYRY